MLEQQTQHEESAHQDPNNQVAPTHIEGERQGLAGLGRLSQSATPIYRPEGSSNPAANPTGLPDVRGHIGAIIRETMAKQIAAEPTLAEKNSPDTLWHHAADSISVRQLLGAIKDDAVDGVKSIAHGLRIRLARSNTQRT